MSLTLTLDTTGDALLMGLLDNGSYAVIVDSAEPETLLGDTRYHSSRLLPEIKRMLSHHGVRPKDISAIALNIGPGSFTGIRTGVTLAKLWAHYGEAKLYALDTFSILMASSGIYASPRSVALNAFRGSHYWSVLAFDPTTGISWITPPEVCRNDAFDLESAPLLYVDPSLSPLLSLEDYTPVTFERLVGIQTLLNTPFASQFQISWQDLSPNYMQLPHITVKK